MGSDLVIGKVTFYLLSSKIGKQLTEIASVVSCCTGLLGRGGGGCGSGGGGGGGGVGGSTGSLLIGHVFEYV